MSDWLSEYKTTLKEAEKKLHKCEALLKENGIDCPIQQPKIARTDKIWLPTGYIRTAGHYRKAYQLPVSIDDLDIRNNIAYALQYTDFLNYIDNRFYLGDFTIKDVFYRMSTAHVMSIVEALLFGLVKTLHGHCVKKGLTCNKAGKCKKYIKSHKKLSFKKLLVMVKDKGIYSYTDADIINLCELKEIRDRLHLWDAGNSDFHDEKFSVKNYNDAIAALVNIRDNVISAFRNYEASLVFGCEYTA